MLIKQKPFKCQYNLTLLQDIIIKLLSNNNLLLHKTIYKVVKKYCIAKRLNILFNEKTVAYTLFNTVLNKNNIVNLKIIYVLQYIINKI